MAKEKTDLSWQEIDVDTLDGDAKALYTNYKLAYQNMKSARKDFEDEMQSLAPDGKRLVFGYNFGKLSVAVADKVAEKAKPQAKQSLGDWLKTQTNSGRRV